MKSFLPHSPKRPVSVSFVLRPTQRLLNIALSLSRIASPRPMQDASSHLTVGGVAEFSELLRRQGAQHLTRSVGWKAVQSRNPTNTCCALVLKQTSCNGIRLTGVVSRLTRAQPIRNAGSKKCNPYGDGDFELRYERESAFFLGETVSE